LYLQAGGKEDSAQGVGTEVEKLDDAVAAAQQYIQQFA
jgi:alanyl-tRNA synthetase